MLETTSLNGPREGWDRYFFENKPEGLRKA
jgi:hypothetical protein